MRTYTSQQVATNFLDFIQDDTNDVASLLIIMTQKDIGSGFGVAGRVPGSLNTWKGNSGFPSWDFASKENTTGASAPTLTLVPEPMSMLLLGLGGMAALLRRRRA